MNSAGQVGASYTYDAFGNLLQQSGTAGNAYQYQTKQTSSTTGLVYFGARYYNPLVGRWLTQDPAGMIDGPNVYVYVSDNPVNFVDPLGLASIRTRRLDEPVGTLADVFYGQGDIRGEHWQIFYEDGTNSEYLGDSNPLNRLLRRPIFGADDVNSIPAYSEGMKAVWDDSIMSTAEARVQSQWINDFRLGRRKYSHPRNDCQQYVLEVIRAYREIEKERATSQKECGDNQ